MMRIFVSRPTYCVSSKALKALGELYDEFTGPKSSAYKYMNDPKAEFARFVELELGVSMDKIEHVAAAGGIGRGDIRGLRLKLSDHVKNLMNEKLPGSVNWYVPAAFAKKDPTIYETLTNYQKAGFKLQARMIKDDADKTSMFNSMRSESEIRALKDPDAYSADNPLFGFIKSLAGKTPQQKHNSLTKLKRQAIAEAKAGKEGAVERLE